MISRALRGKCPLSFYNQGKGRRDPEKPTRQNAEPRYRLLMTPVQAPNDPPASESLETDS